MAGIPITGIFTPQNNGQFPLLSDQDLKGGWRVVADQTARDAIYALDRVIGMIAYSVADGYGWQLIGGVTNSNWAAVTTAPSGAAGGDLGGTYPNPTVIAIQGVSVSNTFPAEGYVLRYSSGSGKWIPVAQSSLTGLTLSQVLANGNTVGGHDIVAADGYIYDGYSIYAGTTIQSAEQVGSVVAVSTSANSPRGLISWQHSNDTNSAHIVAIKTRGTRTSQLTVANGDNIGTFLGRAYDGSSYLGTTAIRSVVNGSVSIGNVPSDLVFLTGTNNNPVEAFRVSSVGVLSSQVSSPVLQLGLNAGSGAGSAAATGTIRLPTSFTVNVRNVTDSGDATCLTATSNTFTLGAAGSGKVIGGGGAITLGINTTNYFTASSTGTWNAGAPNVGGRVSGTSTTVALSIGLTDLFTYNGTSTTAMGGDQLGVTGGANNGVALTVRGGDASNATVSNIGGSLTLRGGNAGPNVNNTSIGGNVIIHGGDGYIGGSVSISSGTPTNGDGYNVTITAGTGVGTNKNAGHIYLNHGDPTGSGATSSVAINKLNPVLRIGLPAGSGTGSAASTGTVRVHNGWSTFGRNTADTLNVQLMSWGPSTDTVQYGAGNSFISIPNGGSITTSLGGTVRSIFSPTSMLFSYSGTGFIGFSNAVTGTKTFGINGGSSATADLLVLAGQDTNLATTATAGKTQVRGGNALGSGAGNIFTGGALELSGGDSSGVAGVCVGGNIILRGGNGNFGGSVSISSGTPTAGDGYNVTITAATGVGSNKNGGDVIITSGNNTGTGIPGSVLIENNSSVILVEAAHNAAQTQSILSLCRDAKLTTTEMPANTGDKVIYIGNAATVPTANSVSGGILYVDTGALKYRGTSGTTTTVGPADPHCPTCGSDFMMEHESEKYGYNAICMKCLGDFIGSQPWIIKQKIKE